MLAANLIETLHVVNRHWETQVKDSDQVVQLLLPESAGEPRHKAHAELLLQFCWASLIPEGPGVGTTQLCRRECEGYLV